MKKTERQKIVDRIVRTLQPLSASERRKIIAAATLLLDDEEDEIDETLLQGAPSDPPEDE